MNLYYIRIVTGRLSDNWQSKACISFIGTRFFKLDRSYYFCYIFITSMKRQIFDIKSGDTLLVLGDEEQGIAIVKADVMKELAVKILKGLGKLSNGIEDEK